MSNVDRLLRDQVTAELGQLTFTDAQKQQLIERLAPAEAKVLPLRRSVTRTLLSATTAVALAGSAVAMTASHGLSPRDVVAEVFGRETADSEIVDKIGHPVGATDTSNGVRITADSIIGDEQNYAMVFTVEKEDGTAFAGLPPLGSHGTYPLWFKTSHTDFATNKGAGGSAYFFDADPNDNAIQYVENMTITSTEALHGQTAKVKLKDLAVVGDNDHVIARGTWKFNIRVDYENASIPRPAGQEFRVPAGPGRITKLTASPLALNVEYEVTAPHFQSHSEYADLPAAEAVLADGTAVSLTQSGSHCDAKEDIKRCSAALKFPRLMDPSEVRDLRLQ